MAYPTDSTQTAHTIEDGPESHHALVLPVRPFLFVVFEADRTDAGGARYELSNVDEVIIGRGAERTATLGTGAVRRLEVKVPGGAMSGVHARICRQGTQWVLEDAESTNGSHVNGRRVSSTPLTDGDCIEIGHTIFTLHTALPTPSRTAAIFDSSRTPAPAAGLATLVPALSAAFAQLASMAPSKVPIAITGATGTGKEMIARAVHALSGRRGPLVAVNCGALAPNLVESQLFGHVRGAFSGAIRDEPGFVRSAEGGTLFLDEIGEMPKNAQVALLRVLQQGEVVPIGSARAINVDLRVVAASQDPLSELTERDVFRADLQARIEGYRVELPSLSERMVDLGVIVAALVEAAGMKPPTLRRGVGRQLYRYEWPFNIRELEQTLRRAVTLAGGQSISKEDLPEPVALAGSGVGPDDSRSRSSMPPALSDADARLKSQLVENLERYRGNISEVANAMGKARMQIHRWMQRLGIDPHAFRK